MCQYYKYIKIMLLIATGYFVSWWSVVVYFYYKLKNYTTTVIVDKSILDEDDIVVSTVNDYKVEEQEPILLQCDGDMASMALLRILSESYSDIHILNSCFYSDDLDRFFTKLHNNDIIHYHKYHYLNENTNIICEQYNIKYVFNPMTFEDKTYDMMNDIINSKTYKYNDNNYTTYKPFENISIDYIKKFIDKYDIIYENSGNEHNVKKIFDNEEWGNKIVKFKDEYDYMQNNLQYYLEHIKNKSIEYYEYGVLIKRNGISEHILNILLDSIIEKKNIPPIDNITRHILYLNEDNIDSNYNDWVLYSNNNLIVFYKLDIYDKIDSVDTFLKNTPVNQMYIKIDSTYGNSIQTSEELDDMTKIKLCLNGVFIYKRIRDESLNTCYVYNIDDISILN